MKHYRAVAVAQPEFDWHFCNMTIYYSKLTVRVIVLLLNYRHNRVQVRASVCRDRLIPNEENSATLETLCQFRGIDE